MSSSLPPSDNSDKGIFSPFSHSSTEEGQKPSLVRPKIPRKRTHGAGSADTPLAKRSYSKSAESVNAKEVDEYYDSGYSADGKSRSLQRSIMKIPELF